MNETTNGRPLVYVADSHLTNRDPETDSFIAFLHEVGARAGTVYLLGDLFNVWFGEPKFRMPHQRFECAHTQRPQRNTIYFRWCD